MVLINETIPLLVTLALVLVVSGGTVFVMVRALGRPLADALVIAAGLAQIGEFAFILSGLGIALNVLPVEARDLILGASILSIFANPLLFTLADRLKARYAPAPLPCGRARGGGRSCRPRSRIMLCSSAMDGSDNWSARRSRARAGRCS